MRIKFNRAYCASMGANVIRYCLFILCCALGATFIGCGDFAEGLARMAAGTQEETGPELVVDSTSTAETQAETEARAKAEAERRAQAEEAAKRKAVCEAMAQFDYYYKMASQSSKKNEERMTNRDGSSVADVAGAIGDFQQAMKVFGQLELNLASIDVSTCPPDFQTAFIYYLQKFDEFVQIAEQLGGSQGFTGFFSGLWRAGSSGEAISDDLEVAEQGLREMAAKYGYNQEE